MTFTSSRRQFFAKRAAAKMAPLPDGESYDVAAVVTGTVDLVTYQDENTGFVVFRVARGDDPTMRHRVVGTLDGITEGVSGRFFGRWSAGADGPEFHADGLERALPITIDGCVSYIAVNKAHFKGIGAVMAVKLVRHFGAPDIFATLGGQPERLREVLTPQTADKHGPQFVAHWENEKAHVMQARIHSQGYSHSEARAIVKHFGEQAGDIVLKDPYRLVAVPRIGFLIADERARAMGLSATDPARIAAGALHAVTDLRKQGHTGAPYALVADTALKCLKAGDLAVVQGALDGLVERHALVAEYDLIYDPIAREHEERLARCLAEGSARTFPLTLEENAVVDRVFTESDMNAEQRAAGWNALTCGVSVLTGGPGTGKTTTLSMIVAACKALKWPVQIMAPTGKAAQRAEQVSGMPAETLHRACGGYRPKPLANARPLPRARLIVFEEATMIGTANAEWASTGIDWPNTRVLFLGDVDQLESVEHGQLLKDLIDSGVAPTTRLHQLYRQAHASAIVTAAIAVNHREMPRLTPPEGVREIETDFLFRDLTLDVIAPDGTYLPYDPEERSRLEQSKGVDYITDALTKYLVPRKKVNIAMDTQVLVPTHRSLLGTRHLNVVLQQIANPDGAPGPTLKSGYQIRVGDKMIVNTNTKNLSIYNGDLALVVDATATSVIIDLSVFGKATPATVELKDKQVNLLDPAWAMTIHKSQGSEFPYVLMGLQDGAHFTMLRKRILYTGMTRAKKWLLLASTRKTLQYALSERSGDPIRHTGLQQRLQAIASAIQQAPRARQAA